MLMPTTVPIFQGLDSNGKAVNKLLKWGCQIEEDPDRAGYARLAALERGSPLRFGKSYVALGLSANLSPVVVPATDTSGEINFRESIQESGWLGHFILYGVPTTPILSVIEIKRRGDSLLSGNVPANMFEPTSFYNPVFGHFIDTNTQLTVNFRNTGAADLNVVPGFTLI